MSEGSEYIVSVYTYELSRIAEFVTSLVHTVLG